MTPPACPRCGCPLRPPDPLDGDARLTCRRCGASQSFTPPDKPGASWQRKGPYALRCGCDSTGGRCEEEGRLYAAIETAHRGVGDLTRARAAYHAHFAP